MRMTNEFTFLGGSYGRGCHCIIRLYTCCLATLLLSCLSILSGRNRVLLHGLRALVILPTSSVCRSADILLSQSIYCMGWSPGMVTKAYVPFIPLAARHTYIAILSYFKSFISRPAR